jgi:hypothetical protein
LGNVYLGFLQLNLSPHFYSVGRILWAQPSAHKVTGVTGRSRVVIVGSLNELLTAFLARPSL